MAGLVRFGFADGDSVVVEAAESEVGVARVSRAADGVARAERTFEGALGGVKHAAEVVLQQFQTLTSRPDEVSIEFGVRLNAQAGAVITRAGIDSHLKVSLMWRKAETGDGGNGAPGEGAGESPEESAATPSGAGPETPCGEAGR